eukprot:24357_1
MLGILMYLLGLVFYTIISFTILKMFVSKLINLSLLVPDFNLTQNELNLALSYTKTEISKANNTKKNTTSVINNLQMCEHSTVEYEVENTYEVKKNIAQHHDTLNVLKLASKLSVLGMYTLLSTIILSIMQLILTNIPNF